MSLSTYILPIFAGVFLHKTYKHMRREQHINYLKEQKITTIGADEFECYRFNVDKSSGSEYKECIFKTFGQDDRKITGYNGYPKTDVYTDTSLYYVSHDDRFIASNKDTLHKMQMEDYDKTH